MTVMITRRTLRRTHLLRPDPQLNNLFIYCLAVCAEHYGVAVHAAVVMSTHEHLVLTDTRGELPRFLQDLHRLLALGIKVLRKWEGAVWDHEKTSVVELRTPQAVLEKIAYVIANPVAAGLVRRAHQWTGLTTRPERLGCTSWTAPRPDTYFDKKNPSWPAVATLRLELPKLDMTAHRVRTAVADEVAHAEDAARAVAMARGERAIGRERIARLSPYERARSWEPLRGRNPTFAVGRGQREAFFEALTLLRAFRKAHRAARELWRNGDRHLAFPMGTWLMRWAHGAKVEPL
jgi:putative transposase